MKTMKAMKEFQVDIMKTSTGAKSAFVCGMLAVLFAASGLMTVFGMIGVAISPVTLILVVVSAVGLIASITAGFLLKKSIDKPMGCVIDQLKKLANGEDLDALDENEFSGTYKTVAKYLNDVRSALYLLLGDSGSLVQYAINGDLSARIDVTKHKGGYKSVMEGLNHTIDVLVAPTEEVLNVLDEAFIKGNLNVSVNGDYKGDNAKIKDTLNRFLSRLRTLIEDITNVLSEIGQGDLDIQLAEEYKGAFASFNQSIGSILESLNNIMTGINSSADQVAAGTKQVSDGSQEISQGATEQASSIEELTTTTTEIAEQTKQNAENANRANELTLEVKTNAARGSEQMKSMQQAMAEINESSANISRIIKVIDDIAFQTNILALNAAVEAARAGVHGKGFAVVAEEVRNLAAKSADAAKQTTDLIEGSIKKAEVGTKIADETATALAGIVGGVDKVAELVGSIASASNEQASAITQVNNGIEQMSQVVQTNSATSEEQAAAAEELSSQAEMLKNMVGQFRLRSVSGKPGKADIKHDKNKAQKEASKSEKAQIRLSDSEFGKY